MDFYRWRRVEEICHGAITRQGAERAAFLDRACGDDAELRREVDSLLTERSGVGDFLEVRPWQASGLESGTRIGPYEVLSLLGKGGIGEVYRARDPRLRRDVAIKVLPDDVKDDPQRRERLLREAEAVAALSHPHICVLYDIGQHEDTDFLVMEYLEGETLEARLRAGPLPLDEALALGVEVADALATAHEQGVLHRDLKPGNIMLTGSGAKLLDLGLAKPVSLPRSASATTRLDSITAEGTLLGTLAYVAPEQLSGHGTDVRTDIFSFGVVLYEMVTGRHPFRRGSQAETISAILNEAPPPLDTDVAGLDSAIGRLVGRLLEKRAADRPASMREVLEALQACQKARHGR